MIPQSPIKAPQNINVQAHDFLSSPSVSDWTVETIDKVSSPKSDTIEYSFDRTSDNSLCISFSRAQAIALGIKTSAKDHQSLPETV